ncbi:MAG TPA: electron transfer flavoprotein subunit beta/FixA family protein [Gryllotalpicola sp.]
MKIVVLIKQVPDTYSDRVIDTTTGLLDRDASEAVIDEIDERALEVALQAKDGDKKLEVVALTVGPVGAKESLRRALAMGADAAVHVVDERLAGADAAHTAAVLAAAVRAQGFDLVIAGNESTDGRGGVVPAAVAEHLGIPLLSYLDVVQLAPGGVSGTRRSDGGTLDVHAPLPAIVSVTERNPEARFPGFKGIMSAKRKPLAELTVADLGVELAAGAHATIVSAAQRPPREAGTKVVDDGTAAARLADYLADAHLI